MSMMTIAGIIESSIATRIPCHRLSYRATAPTTSAAVESSTSGYSAEIRAPHALHRPRRRIHESTGTLSRFRISVPHDGHRDRGRISDPLTGTRLITTIMKLPTTNPNGNAANARSQITPNPTPGTADRPLLHLADVRDVLVEGADEQAGRLRGRVGHREVVADDHGSTDGLPRI